MKAVIRQPRDQKPLLRTPIPGPRSRRLRQKEDRHLAPGLQNFALLAGIVAAKARGSAITDVDGNTFLDIIGGIGVNGLGHSHPEYLKLLSRQLQKISVGSFTSEARVDLLRRLVKLAPSKNLHRLQLYSSGAEAVESALRLAKSHTGKFEFVSFWGGFHGKTMGALSLMGSDFKRGLGPLVPGAHTVPYANCYRCPLKMKYPECGLACVDVARKQLKYSSSGKIAAFIVEPMQGTAGNVIPPPGFLPAIKELAREFDALLIADEMITGLGRTGKAWGVSHTKVVPDIMTLGKQFGGGFPVSAVLTTDEIANSKPWANPSGSSSSYGGNPLAAAAAGASLKIIEEENLIENSRRVGRYFLNRLLQLQDRFPMIGNVQGEGLFIGVELVRDRATREPLAKSACSMIFKQCLKRGLLTMAYSSSFRIQPALTIDEGTVETAVGVLEEVFRWAGKNKLSERIS